VIVLDITVLIYAVGEEHPLRAPCQRLLVAHGEGRVDGATTVEAIQEFAHLRARRRSRSDAVDAARAFASSLTMLMATPEDLDRGLGLFADHPGLGSFDAVLAAVAMAHGAEALVSADIGFAAIPGLRWIDPATPAIESILG
jgi:predicted nucleic acid-binding protein